MIIEHLTKGELLNKLISAAGIFEHEGTYSLDISWDAEKGTISLMIVVEAKE